MGDGVAEVGLGSLLHFTQNHSRDLLGSELLLLAAAQGDGDGRLGVGVLDLERKVLPVRREKDVD